MHKTLFLCTQLSLNFFNSRYRTFNLFWEEFFQLFVKLIDNETMVALLQQYQSPWFILFCPSHFYVRNAIEHEGVG